VDYVAPDASNEVSPESRKAELVMVVVVRVASWSFVGNVGSMDRPRVYGP